MDEQLTLLEPPERVLSTLNQDGTRRWLRPKVATAARVWVMTGAASVWP